MESPRRPGARRRRLGRLARVAARPLTSLRTQIVLLVALATLLISLLATWVSTAAVEEFLTDRLEARFPAMLAAKSRELRRWYDRIGLDLSTFVTHPIVRRTVPEVVAGTPGDARRTLHVHMVRALSRANHYSALVICSRSRCPLVAVGSNVSSAAQRLTPPVRPAGEQRRGRIEPGLRRQLLAESLPSINGGTLRAMIDLRALDRLLATGLTRPTVELYVVDAEGRYVAGTQGSPPQPLRYRGPQPDAARAVTAYENARGEEVFGAARPVGRFGWTMVIEQDHDAITVPVRELVSDVFRIVLVLGLILVLGAVALALSIVRPLQALAAAADRAAEGDAEMGLPRPRGARELRRLTEAFNEMTLRLSANRRELERRAEELERLSITDGLTGAYNHRHFQEQFPLEAKRAERAGLCLALILVDIDDFKAINDTFGHAVGDGILRRVARVMAAEVRVIDLVARYGGEEFAVLTQQQGAAGAVTLADKIRRAIADIEYVLPRGQGPATARTLRLTVSAGVGLYAPGDDIEGVFEAADAALYRAKRAGKNRVELARRGEPS